MAEEPEETVAMRLVAPTAPPEITSFTGPAVLEYLDKRLVYERKMEESNSQSEKPMKVFGHLSTIQPSLLKSVTQSKKSCE